MTSNQRCDKMSVDIKAIGLFRCKSESESDVIQILREDDLAKYQDVTRITQELIGRLIGKDFVGAKSARVHKFTKEASKPRDVDAISTQASSFLTSLSGVKRG